FFTGPPTTNTYPLSLHDALPISTPAAFAAQALVMAQPDIEVLTAPALARAASSLDMAAYSLAATPAAFAAPLFYWDGDDDEEIRSEEHTSELQSRSDLVCRLLLE